MNIGTFCNPVQKITTAGNPRLVHGTFCKTLYQEFSFKYVEEYSLRGFCLSLIYVTFDALRSVLLPSIRRLID